MTDADQSHARDLLQRCPSLPRTWRKLLEQVALGARPEAAIAENEKAYGDHGRRLFDEMVKRETEDWKTQDARLEEQPRGQVPSE